MKKILLVMLCILFLAGCGGGGADSEYSGEQVNTGSDPGSSPGSETPNEGPVGTLTVNFPPVQTVSAQAVVDTASFVRNRARLVVRKTEEVTTTVPIYQQICDEYECWNEQVGQTTKTEIKETFKNISDGPLDGAGAGSVSIEVPPGEGYSLEVLTYLLDDVTGSETFDNRFILEYGKSVNTFAIGAGASTTVSISLGTDLAVLVLPAGPILADSEYEVSAPDRSEALRDYWYARQTLNEADLTDQWFLHESSDASDVAGEGPLTLKAPWKTEANPSNSVSSTWKMWVRGQFFISDHLLKSDETNSWRNWTFGSGYAGELNPWGSVDVVFQ